MTEQEWMHEQDGAAMMNWLINVVSVLPASSGRPNCTQVTDRKLLLCSRAPQAHVLRDIFGNLHKKRCEYTNIKPAILGMAEAAYEARPDGTLYSARLAVLADSLEDDGCDDEDLLLHLHGERECWWCRGEGACQSCGGVGRVRERPHYRGCWALDIILGKV